MSEMGHFRALPHRNITGRFTSISRHTIARSGRTVLQAIIDGEDHRIPGARPRSSGYVHEASVFLKMPST